MQDQIPLNEKPSWRQRLRTYLLDFDARLDSGLFRSGRMAREAFERFRDFMDRFHVAGWRRWLVVEPLSELATFGESFGCENASFRLSLAPALLERLQQLAHGPAEQIAVAAREAASPSNETVSVHLVTARAVDGEIVTARAITMPHFGLGGSVVSTAAPAAACVRLFARGALTATGAQPPERCIHPGLMFAELETRGCTFSWTS